MQISFTNNELNKIKIFNKIFIKTYPKQGRQRQMFIKINKKHNKKKKNLDII